MGRLVRIPKRGDDTDLATGFDDVFAKTFGQAEEPALPAPAPDNYLERIAKYVPFEVLAFFISINAILEQAVKSGGKAAVMAGLPVALVSQGALLVALILVPLFVWYVREEGDAWRMNALVSTLAFPFWAYAIGAVAFNDYWDGNLAVILLATFTVVSGLVAPRSRQPQRAERKAKIPQRTDRPHLDLIEPSPA